MGQITNLGKKQVDIVVLMAGEGKRMRPFTLDRPKALISCEDGLSIFNHIIEAFSLPSLDVTIMPVIGHGAIKVQEEIKKLNQSTDFSCVYNPFYNSSGPIISLLLGLLQTQSENIVVVNGDTFVRKTLTEEVSSWLNNNSLEKKLAGLCVSSSNSYTKDDMKVSVDAKGNFIEVGKHIETTKTSVKSAGVFCIKGRESKKALMDRLQLILMDNQSLKTNYHWHNILNEIRDFFKVELIKVSSDSWYEIDTPEELKILNAL